VTPSPATDAKACCAAAYSHDVVALVLGESYHPGGLALTRRLADRVGVAAGQRVLDVASGPGTSALLLAREYGAQVTGVDLGEPSVARAADAAAAAGLSGQVRFAVGDAERIPYGDASFDAVVCECAFCTFPDKPTAATELARVLRPGGRVGITDVTVAPGALSGELTTLAGWVACIADARPVGEYEETLAAAGLRTVATERHDAAMARMVEQIEGRLVAFRAVAGGRPALAGVDWDRALAMTRLAAAAVADGAVGYALLVAEKAAG
jgi:arsenite methyltransferase